MSVNTRLLNNPILQRMPKNDREWIQYSNELAKFVLRIAKLGDGSITDSTGTTISGLDEMPGVLPGQSSLNTITAFNRSSVQDAVPITAADVGATATATIASHSVYYDGTSVAYNAGTVTGLAFSTLYYIYADDEDKAGGAVTYLATTTKTDIMGSKSRYYVGSVTTPADGGGPSGGGGGGGGGEIP